MKRMKNGQGEGKKNEVHGKSYIKPYPLRSGVIHLLRRPPTCGLRAGVSPVWVSTLLYLIQAAAALFDRATFRAVDDPASSVGVLADLWKVRVAARNKRDLYAKQNESTRPDASSGFILTF